MHEGSDGALKPDENSSMIRAQWTKPLETLGKNHRLLCIRRLSEYVTEMARTEAEQPRRVIITHEPAGFIHRSYDAPFDIVKAFWFTFPKSGNSSPELECFCIVGKRQIDFYSTSDDHYYSCVTPFNLRGVYPCSFALLLEREMDCGGAAALLASPFVMPRVFSLSHPFHELLPVLSMSKESVNEAVYCWETEPNSLIVDVSSEFLLTYDEKESIHRVYAARRPPPSLSVPNESTRAGMNRLEMSDKHPVTPRLVFHNSSLEHAGLTPPCAGMSGRVKRTTRSVTAGRLSRAIPYPSGTHHTPVTPTITESVGHRYETPNRSMHSVHSLGDTSPFIRLSRLPVAASTPRGADAATSQRLQAHSLLHNIHPVYSNTSTQPLRSANPPDLCEIDDDSPTSEVLLQLVWSEKEPSGPASKMFSCRDLPGGRLVSWLVPAAPSDQRSEAKSVLRVLRVMSNGGGVSFALAPPTFGGPSHFFPAGVGVAEIPAANAFAIPDVSLIAVVPENQSSVLLYSGATRVAVLVLKMSVASPVRLRVHAACAGAILLEVNGAGTFLHARLPATFISATCARLWSAVSESLQSQQERVTKLLASWLTNSRRYEASSRDELLALCKLILEHCGFRQHPKETKKELPEKTDDLATDSLKENAAELAKGEEAAPAKQSRSEGDVSTDNDKLAAIAAVLETTRGSFPSSGLRKKEPALHGSRLFSSSHEVVFSRIADAPLSNSAPLIFQALHAAYEESRLTVHHSDLLFALAQQLTLFARLLGCASHMRQYRRDWPLLGKMVYFERIEDDKWKTSLIQLSPDIPEEEKPRRSGPGAALASPFPTGSKKGGVVPPATTPLASTLPPGHPPSILRQPPPSAKLAQEQAAKTHQSLDDYIVALLEWARSNRRFAARVVSGGMTPSLRAGVPSCISAVADMTMSPTGSFFDSPETSYITSAPPQLPATPPCTSHVAALLLVIAIGTGCVRSVADASRLLGVGWARRLRVEGEGEEEVLGETMEGDNGDGRRNEQQERERRCAQMLRLLFSPRHQQQHSLITPPPPLRLLRPPLALLLTALTRSRTTLLDVTGANSNANFAAENHVTNATNDSSVTAPSDLQSLARSRWPKDLRAHNAIQMLDSTRPVFVPISVITAPGAVPGAEEHREIQDNVLLAIAHRTFSQAFGRALYLFRTELPSPNEPVRVPEICLAGRSHPSNMPLELQTTEASGPGKELKVLRDWGDFYNGVAAGLRLVSSETAQADSEWLTMCHSHDKGPVSSGLLLAFGLSGHIVAMNMFSVHELLIQQDKKCSIALLLGYSAALVGTSDLQMHKVLVTHLPFLMGATLLDIHIDPLVQTAAVSSLGLLFAQTSNAVLIDKLINQMGRPPPADSEPASDRYSYALSCGFAIGLIGLGDGCSIALKTTPCAQAMSSFSQRLLVLMRGGDRAHCVLRSEPSLDALTVAQMADAGAGIGGAAAAAGRAPVGSTANPAAIPVSNHVREDDRNVNVHITAHGATIALGLLFMKTGNKEIADALALPDSVCELEEIRPDLIAVRVLARCLVMWDEIQPNDVWIRSNIPDIIKRFEVTTISCWKPSSKVYANREEQEYWDKVIDRETVAQITLYAISGACFAMALKLPSTRHAAASRIISDYIRVLIHEGRTPESFARICRLAGRSVCSLCTHILLLSHAIVNAGSGELSVLQAIRAARIGSGRSHVDLAAWARSSSSGRSEIYAQQLPAHLSLGLLFAGGGRYALKSDSLSVAALIIAFYPVTAQSVADNRLYLQPLRFLSSLALERRLLSPVDATTGHLLNLSMTVQFRDPVLQESEGVKLSWTTPQVLPPLPLLKRVVIGGFDSGYEQKIFLLDSEESLQDLKNILGSQDGKLPLNKMTVKEDSDPGCLSRYARYNPKFDDLLAEKDVGADNKLVAETLAANRAKYDDLEADVRQGRPRGIFCGGGDEKVEEEVQCARSEARRWLGEQSLFSASHHINTLIQRLADCAVDSEESGALPINDATLLRRLNLRETTTLPGKAGDSGESMQVTEQLFSAALDRLAELRLNTVDDEEIRNRVREEHGIRTNRSLTIFG